MEKNSSSDPPEQKTNRAPYQKAAAPKHRPGRSSAHDQPVDFPVSETAVSQADGVP